MIREDFLDQFPPMQRAKARAALARAMRLDGEYMPRWQAAEVLAKRPVWQVQSESGRVVTRENGAFYMVKDLTETMCDYVSFLRR